MNSSIGKKQGVIHSSVTSSSVANSKATKDFKAQMISQMMLRDILQNAQQIHTRNSQLSRFVQSQRHKQSEQFTVNNCNEVIQNFFFQPSQLSPQIANQQSVASPSRSPYSFLKFYQDTLQTERTSNCGRRQILQHKKNSVKIQDCNKIYILKKKNLRATVNQRNSSVRSIKLNDTSTSVVGRSSYRPQANKISTDNATVMPRLSSRGRQTFNPFSSALDYGSKSNLFQPLKNSIDRLSFHDEKDDDKSQDRNNLIKLQNNKMLKKQQKLEPKEKQTNEYIAFLRQRKQKLENIMKVFDLDDQQKKNHKIQRQNLLKQSKTQSLAQTFKKMPSMTTDYEGNPVYLHEAHPKTLGNHHNSPNKSFKRLPKYEAHDEGVLSQNISFKIKDMDDKTKNVLNQIFSSASTTPGASKIKIGFNMKNGTKIRKKKGQKTQNNIASKIFVNYQEVKQDFQTLSDEGMQKEDGLNNTNQLKNIYDHGKGLKSALKIPSKSIRNHSQNSVTEKNKENIPADKQLNNSKHLDFTNFRQKSILKTEQSSRSNIANKNSMKQLQAMHRQGYASHKERIHPNLFKHKKATINTEEYECNKIVEASNENTDRNLAEREEPLKKLFQALTKNK